MPERSAKGEASSMPHRYSSGGAIAPSAKQTSPTQDPLVCPALHLYPLNDTFVPKQINLAQSSARSRIKIGRYSNNKTVPSPVNGYFDSKVLSRAHAEVWFENDRVFLKDIKSSNGTFINGTRLSPESQESEPFELHNDDVVDFGIDILTDDNKDILHRRVACRVFLVITPDDALKLRSDFATLYRGGVHGGSLSGAGLCPGAEGGFRRNKPNMNVDQVIARLQTELQKSTMVGTELRALSTSIQQVHETLGGGAVPVQDAPHPELVPPPPPPPPQAQHTASSMSSGISATSLASLEAQLANTHNMLASHVEKIKGLEVTLATYEHVKDELSLLKHELDLTKHALHSKNERTEAGPAAVRTLTDGFDDAASMNSVETVSDKKRDTDDAVADLSEASDTTMTNDAPPPLKESSEAQAPALLARIERLEKALEQQQQQQQQQQQRTLDVEPSLSQPCEQNFERRWEEQGQGWKSAQKLDDATADAASSLKASGDANVLKQGTATRPAFKVDPYVVASFMVGVIGSLMVRRVL